MKFLKTLSWVVVAVVIAIFIGSNWSDVTINLWGNIQADVKLPFLLLLVLLVGFLPPYLLMRSRVWHLKRKLALAERTAAAPPAPSVSDMVEHERGPTA